MNLPQTLYPAIRGSDDIGITQSNKYSSEAIINSNLGEYSGTINLADSLNTLTFNNGFAKFRSNNPITLNINASGKAQSLTVELPKNTTLNALNISENVNLKSEDNIVHTNGLNITGKVTLTPGTSLYIN